MAVLCLTRPVSISWTLYKHFQISSTCIRDADPTKFAYACIYVGSDHFWGFKIFNFNIVWVFRKMNIFWGMKKLWILQNWTIWCVCAGGGGGGDF